MDLERFTRVFGRMARRPVTEAAKMKTMEGCKECRRFSAAYESATMEWFRLQGQLRVAEFSREPEASDKIVAELNLIARRRQGIREETENHNLTAHPRSLDRFESLKSGAAGKIIAPGFACFTLVSVAANLLPAAAAVGELADRPGIREALQWFTREKQWVNEIHLQLCRVPAPTFLEQQRAEWMAAQFRSLGWHVGHRSRRQRSRLARSAAARAPRRAHRASRYRARPA